MHPDPEPIGMIIKAVAFAADKHRNQRRKDDEASPYMGSSQKTEFKAR